jgi:dolichol-phosphate mannosyltransferase
MSKTLAVVIPAYCEEACIEKVLRGWNAVFEGLAIRGGYEIIVVNDGSKDRTGEILEGLAKQIRTLRVVHQKNAGHGAAVLRGYHAAKGAEWVFQVDSDDQFEPGEFKRLWEARDQSDFILGHRKARHDARHRLFISGLARKLIWSLFGVKGKDFNIPFRLMRGEYLELLLSGLPEKLFAPNIFLAILAGALGQDLKFIPVTHKPRTTGSVSILRWRLLKVCLQSVRELIQFRGDFQPTLAELREVQLDTEIASQPVPAKAKRANAKR